MNLENISNYAFAERCEAYLLSRLQGLCHKTTFARYLPVVPLIAGAHLIEIVANIAECYFKGFAHVFGHLCSKKCHFRVGIRMLTQEAGILSCFLLVLPVLAIRYQWNLMRKGETHIAEMLAKLRVDRE
ncbi:MAG: hypothetical protein ACSNEK_05005 [Parachlamydiaceae bacterium]